MGSDDRGRGRGAGDPNHPGPTHPGGSALPLGPGAHGPAVADLQGRLLALNRPCGDDPPGRFGPGTVAAVASFQEAAGLDVDGMVGAVTWQALVEAGYRLGDRQLYHRSPMMRGDDVAELQRQLGALGFDAGRVDGIFGPATSAALVDFQRNSGLGPDGIFGPESAAALERLGRGRTTAVNVAHVREVERLRAAPRQLSGRRVAVGEPGGLGALAAALGHELREVGAVVALLDHPDGSHQAREANDFAADVYLGLRVTAHGGHQAAFFQTAGFESTGGRQLAEAVNAELGACLSCSGEVVGRRLPVLRETRMPAVLVAAGPPGLVVVRTPELARSMARALARWAASPLPLATSSTPAVPVTPPTTPTAPTSEPTAGSGADQTAPTPAPGDARQVVSLPTGAPGTP